MPDAGHQEKCAPTPTPTSDPSATPETPPENAPCDQQPVYSLVFDGAALGLLRTLHAAFEEKIKYDATRDRMIDRLHGELQEYKDDILLKLFRPLVLDLIVLHDNLGKWSSTGGSTPTSVSFTDVQSDLEDILYRYGYETFTVPENSFDARRQRVLRTVPTEDAALDGKISERLRKGFLYGGKVIRPECVAVFKPIKSV
jgi:molecular chaperone GrpE